MKATKHMATIVQRRCHPGFSRARLPALPVLAPLLLSEPPYDPTTSASSNPLPGPNAASPPSPPVLMKCACGGARRGVRLYARRPPVLGCSAQGKGRHAVGDLGDLGMQYSANMKTFLKAWITMPEKHVSSSNKRATHPVWQLHSRRQEWQGSSRQPERPAASGAWAEPAKNIRTHTHTV